MNNKNLFLHKSIHFLACERWRISPEIRLRSQASHFPEYSVVKSGMLQPPQSKKQWYYSGKTDVPFGQRHSKKYFII